MDWLAFEHLAVEIFLAAGLEARKTPAGPDGGVDIELRQIGADPSSPPQALVQCKARSTSPVGVDKVCEIFGVMTARNAKSAVLVSNSEFTVDARAFAAQTKVRLADINWVMEQVT